MKKINVDELYEGVRLDQFMTEYLGEYSRSLVQSWIEAGKISVNGRKEKRNYRLREDDEVTYEIEVEHLTLQPVKMDLDIVYEDAAILVINKPKGLVVHPTPSTLGRPTLVHGLLAHTQDLSDCNGELRPGIVHRIDKDTSGLLVVAKTNDAHEDLVQQLKKRTVKREYLALVHHPFNHQSAIVDAPIGRDSRNRQKMAVTEVNSKPAITRLYLQENIGEYSLLVCELETGRTHQIRVHCQYIKHPIVGDKTYSYKNTLDTQGQCLHAQKLSLIHPTTKQLMHFEAKPPQIFLDTLETIRREKL